MVAVIGAAAVIAAAFITHPWSHGGVQLGISSISHPVVDGRRVIEVTGTVGNLGAGEWVYAFAGRQDGIPPWYPGGPAAISGGSLWTAEITDLPASAPNLSVWAGWHRYRRGFRGRRPAVMISRVSCASSSRPVALTRLG